MLLASVALGLGGPGWLLIGVLFLTVGFLSGPVIAWSQRWEPEKPAKPQTPAPTA